MILISLDGTRPVDVEGAELTTFAELRRRGARASRLIPVFPSNTFPCHVSLVTGVSPDVHGIVNNTFVDAARGGFDKSDDPTWLLAEPLWSLVAGQGVTSAAFHWVGSEGPWSSGRGPRYWKPFDEKVARAGEARSGARLARGAGAAPAARHRLASGRRRGGPPHGDGDARGQGRAARAGPGARAPGRRARRARRLRPHDAADRLRSRHGAGVQAHRPGAPPCAPRG